MIDIEQESAKFDPDGEYVRRWLPVLACIPTQYIHAPWKAPQEALDAAGVDIGFSYPQPIIKLQVSGMHSHELASRFCQCG